MSFLYVFKQSTSHTHTTHTTKTKTKTTQATAKHHNTRVNPHPPHAPNTR